jgi:hypothetical protein
MAGSDPGLSAQSHRSRDPVEPMLGEGPAPDKVAQLRRVIFF